MKKLLPLALAIAVSACGSSTPTAPSTPAAPATQTRNIVLTGDLAFGNVNIGASADKTFTIQNTGNSVLTFTGMTAVGGTGTAGFAASPTTGTVPAGGSVTVTVRFSPTVAQFYSNVLTITSDRITGGNEINVSGTGINNAPLFTISGKGDNTFVIPASVAKVHVTGHFVDSGSNSNFIVTLNGRLFINEILRTSDYDGVLLTPGGGTIAITSSGSIQWTFTEVR